jgi:hypothetical protein
MRRAGKNPRPRRDRSPDRGAADLRTAGPRARHRPIAPLRPRPRPRAGGRDGGARWRPGDRRLLAAGAREPWSPAPPPRATPTFAGRIWAASCPSAQAKRSPRREGRRGDRAGRRAVRHSPPTSRARPSSSPSHASDAAGLSHGPVILAQQARVALGDPIAVGAAARKRWSWRWANARACPPPTALASTSPTPPLGIPDSARNCLSNIRDGGMDVETAADRTMALIRAMRQTGKSGVALSQAIAGTRTARSLTLQPGNGVAKTRTPVARSSSAVSSAKSWLIPLIEGTNSIATGITRDRFEASCSAPDGIDRQRPGATPPPRRPAHACSRAHPSAPAPGPAAGARPRRRIRVVARHHREAPRSRPPSGPADPRRCPAIAA